MEMQNQVLEENKLAQGYAKTWPYGAEPNVKIQMWMWMYGSEPDILRGLYHIQSSMFCFVLVFLLDIV